jgi:hypothetical protein
VTRWDVPQPNDWSYEQPVEGDRPDPLAEPEGYGAPGVPQQANRIVRDGRCCMGQGESRCPEDKTCTLWIGCTAHEHMGPMDYCSQHGPVIVACLRRPGGAVCGGCQAIGERSPVRLLKAEGLDAVQDKPVQDALDTIGWPDRTR